MILGRGKGSWGSGVDVGGGGGAGEEEEERGVCNSQGGGKDKCLPPYLHSLVLVT